MFRTPLRSAEGVDSEQERQKEPNTREGYSALFGAPAENRTPDTLIKSQVLYQLSYRGVFNFVFRSAPAENLLRGRYSFVSVPLQF